jgi:hypothetical protein
MTEKKLPVAATERKSREPHSRTGEAGHRGLVRCTIRRDPPRPFADGIAGERARLILVNLDKWVNGTVLRFGFFENAGAVRTWTGSEALKAQVRLAFKRWADLGIGLRFEEVADRAQAQVRALAAQLPSV